MPLFEESVPLRGLWFLSKWETQDYDDAVARIRPLAGIMVLIVKRKNANEKLNIESVPLRGLWFLSLSIISSITTARWKSFRPLAGIMVLIA